ncbi:hypothetical protein O0L34_g6442 [Tuta absoluta]|nr:hypothetical protein O0L34_g6442 [Tuta absoluta]
MVAIVLTLSYTIESLEGSVYDKRDSHKVHNSLATLKKSKNISQYNIASDKDERTLVLPKVTEFVVPKQRKTKKVTMRSTIQKIIKKTKTNRKVNLRATRPPTQPTRYEVRETPSTTQSTHHKKSKKWNSKYVRYPMPFQKLSAKRDFTIHRKHKRSVNRNRRDVDVTKRVVGLRKGDEDISERDEDASDLDGDISNKDADVNRKDYNRNKRNVDRDLYVPREFDEIEFWSHENKKENAINAHVKKW